MLNGLILHAPLFDELECRALVDAVGVSIFCPGKMQFYRFEINLQLLRWPFDPHSPKMIVLSFSSLPEVLVKRPELGG